MLAAVHHVLLPRQDRKAFCQGCPQLTTVDYFVRQHTASSSFSAASKANPSSLLHDGYIHQVSSSECVPLELRLCAHLGCLPTLTYTYLIYPRSVRVSVHTRGMEWAPSPSPSVWRKRVALEGPQESGRVTSVVRALLLCPPAPPFFYGCVQLLLLVVHAVELVWRLYTYVCACT